MLKTPEKSKIKIQKEKQEPINGNNETPKNLRKKMIFQPQEEKSLFKNKNIFFKDILNTLEKTKENDMKISKIFKNETKKIEIKIDLNININNIGASKTPKKKKKKKKEKFYSQRKDTKRDDKSYFSPLVNKYLKKRDKLKKKLKIEKKEKKNLKSSKSPISQKEEEFHFPQEKKKMTIREVLTSIKKNSFFKGNKAEEDNCDLNQSRRERGKNNDRFGNGKVKGEKKDVKDVKDVKDTKFNFLSNYGQLRKKMRILSRKSKNNQVRVSAFKGEERNIIGVGMGNKRMIKNLSFFNIKKKDDNKNKLKFGKIEKVQKVQKIQTFEKIQKSEKVEKSEKVQKFEKVEKCEKFEKFEKCEKFEKFEKSIKTPGIERRLTMNRETQRKIVSLSPPISTRSLSQDGRNIQRLMTSRLKEYSFSVCCSPGGLSEENRGFVVTKFRRFILGDGGGYFSRNGSRKELRVYG